MTDEIVGGGPPRRRTGLVVVLVAAALLGYAVTHRGRPAPPAAPAAAPRAAQPVPGLARQAVSAAERADLSGRVAAGPAGLRILVDGTDPRIVDAHTLDVRPIPGLALPPGHAAQVLQLGRTLAALVPLYGSGRGMYLVLPGRPAVPFGAADLVLPGRDGDLLAATHWAGSTTVTGLTLDHRVRWRWTLPGTVDPLRDTPAGLVVARYPDVFSGDAEMLLLDKRTGQLRRRLGHGRYPLATDDRSLAYVPARCVPDCAVIRTELATGASRRYQMPAGREPAVGVLSPDGRRLAVSFAGLPATGRTPARPGFVGVLDLRGSAPPAAPGAATAPGLTVVPGLSTPPAQHADVIWSADGRWLVLGVTWPEEELIALWRPAQRLIILPVALPGEPTDATLATLR